MLLRNDDNKSNIIISNKFGCCYLIYSLKPLVLMPTSHSLLCLVCSNLLRPFESVVGKSDFEFCILHFLVIARSVATWQSKFSVLLVCSNLLRPFESCCGKKFCCGVGALRVYRIGCASAVLDRIECPILSHLVLSRAQARILSRPIKHLTPL